MAAAPDDDARKTLAELEAKLRELERELLRGQDTEPPPPPPTPEPPAAEPRDEPVTPPTAEPRDEPATPPTADHAAEPRDEAEPLPAEPHAPSPPEPSAIEPEPLLAEPHAPAPPEPSAVEPPPAEPEPEPLPTLDLEALDHARGLVDDLRTTIDDLGVAALGITAEARTIVDDHGRTLARLEKAAHAAARAEQAAAEAGRIAGTVVVEAGPFPDPLTLIAFRDALAARPDARDAYVRGVEDGRAVIEVHLAPPPTA